MSDQKSRVPHLRRVFGFAPKVGDDVIEKIFAFLLRLYPAPFRRRYTAEAISLLRDCLREETGVARRLRLWFDLLADFATGLPQAYRNSYAIAGASPVPQGAMRLPAFRVLDDEPLRPGSVLLGSVLAVAALAAFIFVMNHASAYHPFARLTGPAGTSVLQPAPTVEQVADQLNEQFQAASPQQRCGFDKLELHPGNIGYVKMNWFADPARCREITGAVMEKLNATDAVIFDLRDDRGGYPEMVRFIAGWFFPHPTPWYNPRAESPEQSVTQPVAESRLTNKPVFILTSPRTFSGAEHFAYDMKKLNRATIVGETTSGASHGNAPLPAGTKPIWEGSGVEPDVRVKAADALATAEKLALNQLHNHRPSTEGALK